MNVKLLIIIGTMAVAITINGGKWKEEGVTSSSPLSRLDNTDVYRPKTTSDSGYNTAASVSTGDRYHLALGVTSDEDIYDALYDGKTLADIAQAHNRDVESIIDLQIAELTEQLDQRLAAGSISPQVYQAQLEELPELIANSVYGQVNHT